jgi:hypothetical protein
MLWIVPAKVAGTWQMPRGDLTLAQTYQMVSGTLTSPGGATPISNAKLRADQISFTAGDKTYTGTVTGNRMEGTVSDGSKWQATRR